MSHGHFYICKLCCKCCCNSRNCKHYCNENWHGHRCSLLSQPSTAAPMLPSAPPGRDSCTTGATAADRHFCCRRLFSSHRRRLCPSHHRHPAPRSVRQSAQPWWPQSEQHQDPLVGSSPHAWHIRWHNLERFRQSRSYRSSLNCMPCQQRASYHGRVLPLEQPTCAPMCVAHTPLSIRKLNWPH